jgi:hypothetical protein
VSFTIPEDVLATVMSKQEMAMELAVIMYHRGRLSLARGRSVCGDGSGAVPVPAPQSWNEPEAGADGWRAFRFLMSCLRPPV